jgi:murein DD-endopeptidase MepM/ murein hydrolase activator NlpD
VVAAIAGFLVLSSGPADAAEPRPYRLPVEDQVVPRSSERPRKEVPERGGTTFEACPVDRPHRYIDDFGDARLSGGFHRHEGIDIFAPYGTPVRAPFDGKVRRSSNWAGGLAVIVTGRNGFVYNAHLSAIGKLGRVAAGDVIGYVGDSGNARGASPHDHFEWHPGGGPARNPYRLLRETCARRGTAGSHRSDNPVEARSGPPPGAS